MLLEGPPSIGQFALNGIWEKALSFEVDRPPSIDELREYLAGRNELAFELFFGASFFGVRFIGTPTFILELSQHCFQLHANFQVHKVIGLIVYRFNPSNRLYVADFTKVPLGSRKVGIAEDDFSNKSKWYVRSEAYVAAWHLKPGGLS